MNSNLALVEIKRKTDDAQPAAFHELAAAKYIGSNRTDFRKLMMAGAIPFIFHLNGKTRLFLRSDLDDYLSSREKHRMVPRENPLVALKGGSDK